MIMGLAGGGGFTGSRMLKAFGVDLDKGSAQAVTRGTGTGLLVTDSGTDTSYSGFIGNEDGDVIKNKAITDEKDAANQQAIQALEEAQEIGLVNVDEHVVQIYTLLSDVITGTRKFHVILESFENGAWTTTGGYPAGVPGGL